jgi:hypothetical protein
MGRAGREGSWGTQSACEREGAAGLGDATGAGSGGRAGRLPAPLPARLSQDGLLAVAAQRRDEGVQRQHAQADLRSVPKRGEWQPSVAWQSQVWLRAGWLLCGCGGTWLVVAGPPSPNLQGCGPAGMVRCYDGSHRYPPRAKRTQAIVSRDVYVV